jgi:outer membrane protein assembly factor BamE (lipoprotein component of BamABCDE complex)
MKVKHFIFCTAVLTGLLLCLSGCRSEAAVNMARARQLRTGMTKAQVLKIMGEPVKEEFSSPDRWYYFVNSVWMDGLTTEEECMPLIFEKGRLAGWGSRFYAEWRAKKELKTKDSKQ